MHMYRQVDTLTHTFVNDYCATENKKENSIFLKYFRFETLMLFIIVRKPYIAIVWKKKKREKNSKSWKKANQVKRRDAVCFFLYNFFASLYNNVYDYDNGVFHLFHFWTYTHCSCEPSKSSLLVLCFLSNKICRWNHSLLTRSHCSPFECKFRKYMYGAIFEWLW